MIARLRAAQSASPHWNFRVARVPSRASLPLFPAGKLAFIAGRLSPCELLTAAGAHDRSSFISLSLRYLSVQRAWSLATTSLRRRWQDSTNLRESANNLKRSGRKLSAILIGAPNVPRNRSPHRRVVNERKRRYLCVAHEFVRSHELADRSAIARGLVGSGT